MMYHVETTARFDREFRKLDGYTQWMLKAWIMKHLEGCAAPRVLGKELSGDKSGLWQYRVGDHRLICQIQGDKLVILSLSVGQRRER